MSNWIRFIVFAYLMLAFSASAEIYKWKDGDVILYSDLPPKNQKYEPLKNPKPANTTQTVPVAASAAKPAAAPVKTAEQQEAERKLKEKACATAKENLQKLKQGGLIYKENAKGEREYLDENALKTETASAEKEAEAACK